MATPEDMDSAQLVRIESLDAVRAAVVETAAAARRELQILSSDLQPQLYNRQPFLEVVRSLATSGRRPIIRALAADIATAVSHDHRLIELARQLSSFIEIRRLDPVDAGITETFLLADRLAFVRQQSTAAGSTAIMTKRSPLEGRRLARRFEELWERASPDSNLRRLWL